MSRFTVLSVTGRTRLRYTRLACRALRGALLLSLAGCLNLDVTNPNAPDRTRAVSQPSDVQALIASSFTSWWSIAQGSQPGFVFSTMADELTSGFADFGILAASSEPRIAYNNSTSNARRFQNEDPWYRLYGTLSNVNDAMAAIEAGVRIKEGTVDVTPRSRAFGKFMQGLTLGYIGLIFDKGYVVDEKTTGAQLATPTFVSYTVLRDSALAKLDEAIAIADTSTFTIPPIGWINGLTIDNKQLVRLARTFQARLIAYTPRTPEERQAADWDRVITLTDQAITTDFAPIGIPDVLIADMRRVVARERSGRPPGDFARVDYFLVGPTEASGKFQAWVQAPLDQRNPFQITTPDRRVQGTAGPSSAGKYVAYNANTIFALDRGVYHRSFYWYLRLGRGTSYQDGPQLAITRAELDLLKAEALIRLNRAPEAVPLINKTRVANGELPPVTIDGPPDDASCVPRKVLSTACGSLWDAYRWEKRIEGLGVDPNVAFFDARGWGTLVAGTPVHQPIPAREIETLSLSPYTFGGGGAGSALPPRYDTCPVSLARCN